MFILIPILYLRGCLIITQCMCKVALKKRSKQKKDLSKFIHFFEIEVGDDVVDNWTPAVSKQFQKNLCKTILEKTGKPYISTSINRTMATIRHVGRWLHQQRPLLAGDPLSQVKDLKTDAPDWSGLTSRQLMRLKSACEQRIKGGTRKNQNPRMETALFYVLMGTGLRESEVVSLNVGQYRQRGLYEVLRHKSKRVSHKIPLPQETRVYLDSYLDARIA
ncbi:TPA: tyrosine-type recombinase/integrase [Legionella pneumophila]